MGFQPDWTWIYNYGGTYSSAMYDAVRGVTKHIESTGNGGEQTVANTLTSFDSDGFTLVLIQTVMLIEVHLLIVMFLGTGK